MDSTLPLRKKLTEFLENVENLRLRERMDEHLPLPEKAVEAEIEIPELQIEFVPILTKEDVRQNKPLVKAFQNAVEAKRLFLFSETKGSKKWTTQEIPVACPGPTKRFGASPFLILGSLPDEGEPITACTGRYFSNTRTLLIESIWLAEGLPPFEEEKKVNDEQQQQRLRRQTVLRWLLTYEGPVHPNLLAWRKYTKRVNLPVKRQRNAGLHRLVGQLELPSASEKVIRPPLFNQGHVIPALNTTQAVIGIFHVVKNPVFVPPSPQDGNSPALRQAEVLHAFHVARTRYLPFALHLNPVLGKHESRHHLLLAFPQVTTRPDYLAIESGVVMAFLVDYDRYTNESPSPRYTDDVKECWEFTLCSNTFRKKVGAADALKSAYDALWCNSQSLFANRHTPHATVIYLHNVPRLEIPRFAYKRASISFEIIVDEDYFEPIGLGPYYQSPAPPEPKRTRLGRVLNVFRQEWGGPPPEPDPDPLFCSVAHSVETDLFAYKYQNDPPYYTRYYGLGAQPVTIFFPSHTEFTSEGRKETYYRLPDTEEQRDAAQKQADESPEGKKIALPGFEYGITMQACVSYTYFRHSKVRIWHVVLRTDEHEMAPENQLSELELIKLMRFFSGSQEFESEDSRRAALRNIWFKTTLGSTSKHVENAEKKPSTETWVELWQARREWFPAFSRSTPASDSPRMRSLRIRLRKVRRYTGLLFWLRGLGRALQHFFRFLKVQATYLFILEKVPENKSWLKTDDNLIQLLTLLTGGLPNPSAGEKDASPGVYYQLRPERKNDPLLVDDDLAVSLRNVRSGVVQIDTGGPSPETVAGGVSDEAAQQYDSENFLGFYENAFTPSSPEREAIRRRVKKLYEDLYHNNIETTDEPGDADDDAVNVDIDKVNEYADYVFKAYCGISLGILDFDRMGFQEIDDTLVPMPDSKTESSFLVIHRGVLAMFGYEDDVMASFWNTMGMNPYLLVPSAVLTHNDQVARDAEHRLDSLLKDLRENRSQLSIPELIDCRNEIDDLLNDDILGNVFQYKTEEELYREGMKRRGIDERVKDSRLKLEQLDKLIQTKHEERASQYQRRIQRLLAIVGAINVYPIIQSFFKDEISVGQKPEYPIGQPVKWDVLEDLIARGVDWLIHPGKWFDFPGDTHGVFEWTHRIFFYVLLGIIVYIAFTSLTDPSLRRRSIQQRKKRPTSQNRYTHASYSSSRSPSEKQRV